MTCTTVTVVAAPVITISGNPTVVLQSDGTYNVNVLTTGTGTATMRLLVDNVEVKRQTADVVFTPSTWTFNINLAKPATGSVTYNVCAELV